MVVLIETTMTLTEMQIPPAEIDRINNTVADKMLAAESAATTQTIEHAPLLQAENPGAEIIHLQRTRQQSLGKKTRLTRARSIAVVPAHP
jgi:hypothetical protein